MRAFIAELRRQRAEPHFVASVELALINAYGGREQ